MTKRWTRRPEGSNWGDFGEDDQLGRLNLLTPEKVRQGVAEVTEGLSFCLSLPLDYPGGSLLQPGRNPPALRANTIAATGAPAFNFTISRTMPHHHDVACDDEAVICLQYSTQWDSLAHVGQEFDADGDGRAEIVYYNGYRGEEHIVGERNGRHVGALALGVENMAAKAIQGRAVMIDLKAHLGTARQAVTYEMLARILAADGVTVEPGDMVCLHTGWSDLVLGCGKNPDRETLHNRGAALDGRDPGILRWISSTGLSALIADNFAVEAYPSREARPGETTTLLPIHEHCLFKLGIPLGELWHLGPLADWLRARRRYRFLLTAPPLRLPGAVGSPVTPVATV